MRCREKFLNRVNFQIVRFFYGMYEESLPSRYLNNNELMNSISRFDQALKAVQAPDRDDFRWVELV